MSPRMPSFRTAGLEDVDAVVQLVESAYRGESSLAGWTTEAHLLDGQRTDPEEVASLTRERQARLLLAQEAGELVGCVLVRADREPEAGAPVTAHIGLFAVRPTLQTRGLGRALLAEAERVARIELGAARAELTVIEQRLDILGWYERRGYARTGATEPFPYDNPRAGLPRRADLRFLVLAKPLRP
ncbi:MAG: GNAT family N-acetyltransferase [Deltaproteobacteria bacterium]